jgi:Xaa-Pro aminopeptidase
LAPFDRQLIDTALLTKAERDWIDTYHARVLAAIGPNLPEHAGDWLAASCASLTEA